MTNDQKYLEKCKKLIEKKLQWHSPEEWRNYEFSQLSDKIFDATGVQLSITTLKRIFGKVKYDNLPSSATLNTLAAFLGYVDWIDLKAKEKITAAEFDTPVPEKNPLKKKLHFSKWLTLATCFVVVLATVFGFVFMSGKSSPGPADTENVVFKSRSLAETVPNSVVFNIDLKNIKSNHVWIQQYWDSTKTILLSPGQKEATGIYYRPGYFRPKLIVDGKIIKEHDLFIRSDQWMATVDHEPVPTYLKKNELVLNNGMTVTSDVITTIKNNSEPTYLTYHLVRPFNDLQSDNFTMETSIKNTYSDGAAVCKTAKIFILGTKGAFLIPFSIPGCASDINLMLGERELSGKTNDLSIFGTDISSWTPVRIEVKNRKVKIFLRNVLLREDNYEKDAGDIVGMRFSFLGAGAVDHVKLVNGKNVTVYEDLFR